MNENINRTILPKLLPLIAKKKINTLTKDMLKQ